MRFIVLLLFIPGCSITTDVTFNAHLEYVNLGENASADLDYHEMDIMGGDDLE